MNDVRGYFPKRFLDFCLAASLLLLALPMLVLISLLVWWEDRSSVIHRQEMIGLKGRPFKLLRFRTLQPGVDKIWKGDAVQEDDPGTTRVGRFLLNARLDGLPLLWNVVRGDMSFVGPIPEKPETVAHFARRLPRYNLRHLARPGLVGLAEVYGSDGLPASQRLKYDLFYIEKMGLVWDLRLLATATWRGFRHRVGLEDGDGAEGPAS